MSGVLIHDGRRAGQRLWTVEAIQRGAARGAILNPFATPRVTAPRSPNGKAVADDVRAAGGEVFFDACTHARLLSTTDKTDFYNQWELWGPAGIGLDTDQKRLEHVERVFNVQTILGTPHLTPTMSLAHPGSTDAADAYATSQLAAGIDSSSAQSLVGTRAFWSSGATLDAYVGGLAALGSPTWVLTMANEFVINASPDLSNTNAFAGLARTVHSLSLRSRVIIANADFSGLPSVAAGADSVGSGWDRGQRTFDPLSFHVNSDDSPRIPASYVTQGNLHAVLRRTVAEGVERWDAERAHDLRGGPMPKSDSEQRVHHLARLQEAVDSLVSIQDRRERVTALRGRYAIARQGFRDISDAIPGLLTRAEESTWVTDQKEALKAYARQEGLW